MSRGAKDAGGAVVTEVQLNGKPRWIRAGQTLDSLIRELELDSRWVIAELNGDAVPRQQFDQVRLQGGDTLELVRAVAGG